MRFHAESKKHAQSDNIEYLLNIKFPGGLHPQPLRSSPNSSSNWPSASRLKLISAERERLSTLPSSEISQLCVAAHTEKHEQAEKELFFNQSAANADFEYWAKMEFWTIEETVALLLGKNPEAVSWKKVQPFLNRAGNFLKERQCFEDDATAIDSKLDFVGQYANLLKRAQRATALNPSNGKILPSQALQWASECGDISIPKQLTGLITAKRTASLELPVVTTQSSEHDSPQLEITKSQSPRDFRPWETLGVVLPDGCFLYHQAAREIADSLSWSDYKLTALLAEMASAINAKALPTVSRKTGLRVIEGTPEFLGVVSVAYVNSWLEARGATYRWQRSAKKDAHGQATNTTNSADDKPWLVKNANDPEPAQSWYTPARYFARKLVLDDSTLLTKRDILASKVVQSLSGVDIKKRGGKKEFNLATIKKAFARVNLG